MGKFLTSVLALLLVLAACERNGDANPDAPTTYSGNWVTFSYPRSWTLTEGNQQEAITISIQGPHDALFTVHIRSLEQAPALEDFIAAQGDAENLLPTGRPAASGRLHGFNQSINLDGVAYQREYHRIDSHDEAAYLVSQVPSAEAIRVQAGLDRIFTTFAFQ